MRRQLAAVTVAVAAALTTVPATSSASAAPEPMSPDYTARDTRNIADAYGRITGPGGQLRNPAYLPALVAATSATTAAHLLEQAARPNHLAVTPGVAVPGWDVGNPLRSGWDGTRGLAQEVRFTNRYGALLRGSSSPPARCRAARGCTTGSRRTSPSAATWCSPTTCRGRG